MERLNSRRPEMPPLQDAAKRILLLDCDNRRREVRAEALMSRGALVDCAAETVVARTLWKPNTYDLLLIDMRGADTDCAAFISFVHEECSQQKVGFYVAEPPYVTASVAECRKSIRQQTLGSAVAGRDQLAVPARRPGETGLSVAIRRIAASRQSARLRTQVREQPQGEEVREERSRGVSASDAVKLAARVLGGL